jgi:hypothetical protein
LSRYGQSGALGFDDAHSWLFWGGQPWVS